MGLTEGSVMNTAVYEWTVEMLHLTQGFSKTFHPRARGSWAAMQSAKYELRDKGYEPVDFDVVRLVRGPVV